MDDDEVILVENIPAPEPATAAPQMSETQKKAAARQAKLLAKSSLRLKLVSGEISSLTEPAEKSHVTDQSAVPLQQDQQSNDNVATEQDAASTVLPTTTDTEIATEPLPVPTSMGSSGTTNAPPKPKWEMKWEREAAAAQRRTLDEDIVEKLKVTESMYMESPKLRDYIPEKSIPDNLLVNPPTSAGLVLNPITVGGGVFLSPSLVTCFLCLFTGLYVGYISVFSLHQVPMYNLILLSATLQTVVRLSLKVLKIPEPRQPSLQKSMISKVLSAIVPAQAKLTLSNIAFGLRFVRDSFEDSFTFAVGYGAARSLTIWYLEGQRVVVQQRDHEEKLIGARMS